MARRLTVLLYGHDVWPNWEVDDAFFPDRRERDLGAQLSRNPDHPDRPGVRSTCRSTARRDVDARHSAVRVVHPGCFVHRAVLRPSAVTILIAAARMNPTRANTDSPLASAISRPTVHAALALTVAIGRFRSTYTSRSVHPTLARGIGVIVPIEEVVAGQVFKGRRTSLRSGSASQVFARSRTASEDEDAGHGPEGRASVGHAFKIGGRAKARRRVRFPSASAAEGAL
jgi:hypothetical protein